jgi:DNA adenine methylase
MNYMGGKYRQGPKIADFILKRVDPETPYYEPFCGAMGVASRIVPHLKGFIQLSDLNEPLINMWRAVIGGWVPPDVITEETYQYYKNTRNPEDPMTAYCGFGMSFGGKWWGGYARNSTGCNFAIIAKRSTLLKASMLLKSKFKLVCCDYLDVKPIGATIYLDPPYNGRTNAYGVSFDHQTFWEYARGLVAEGNQVFLTEFDAPDDWVRVFNFGNTVVGHYAGKPKDGTCESIFMHRSQI